MNQLTTKILKSICPYASEYKLDLYVPYLNEMMPKYVINSLLRIRHFIAQVAHESGSFNYVKEIATGTNYEGRKDLGNVNEGDGVKYKGRGLIQITGRSNYTQLAVQSGIDCINHPELLEQPEYAVQSACWFWQKNGLNELADSNDIIHITKKINGGINGLKDRMYFYVLTQKYIL